MSKFKSKNQPEIIENRFAKYAYQPRPMTFCQYTHNYEPEPVEEMKQTNPIPEVAKLTISEAKKGPKRKVKIPAAVRKIVWNFYIGSEKSSDKCFCCNSEIITLSNFECGHVQSEKDGGEPTIQNLRPLCSFCNKSIGANDMDMFMSRYGIPKRPDWNGKI